MSTCICGEHLSLPQEKWPNLSLKPKVESAHRERTRHQQHPQKYVQINRLDESSKSQRICQIVQTLQMFVVKTFQCFKKNDDLLSF